MRGLCPPGQTTDAERTAFGQCLESARTLVPTRPDPTQDPLRPEGGGGLHRTFDSPSPSFLTHPPTLQRTVWQILVGGLHSISDNDYGRPWPYPQRDVLASLLARHDDDLCLQAAQDAREIVQSQDRAPNITNLFAKKLAELAEARAVVRDALAPTTSNVEHVDFGGLRESA